MTAGRGSDAAEFRQIMESLASDPEGWRGPAGDDFAALMHRVFARKMASLNRDSRGGALLLVDASDVVSEAVLIVEGPARLSLSQNVDRILAMDKPLGYVVGAVATNLARAELSGLMGAGSRQVGRGSRWVLHFEELSRESEGDLLDRLVAEPVWARGQSEAPADARMVIGSFISVLAQRFRVRPEVALRGLEVAGTAALVGDARVGMTPATARRRVGLFMEELPALRGSFDRTQAQAFAWLVFGTERHPEWSLLAECARAVREKDAVKVSPWHSRHALIAAARRDRAYSETSRQLALFPEQSRGARRNRMTA